MTNSYDDIINLPRHISTTRPQMPVINRAAQFAPFAALTSYEAAIKETARLTNKRIELDEYMKDALNDTLHVIADHIKDHPEIAVIYFQPDPKKDGGTYITAIGTAKTIDEYERVMVMTDGTVISMAEIISINVQSWHDCNTSSALY